MIPQFLAKYAEGFDVVYAQRGQRQEGWYLRLSYFLFYRLAAELRTWVLLLMAIFAVVPRGRCLRQARERQRYLRGLRAWVGFRQTGILIDRPAEAGRSKYTPIKLLRLAMDGIFAFSIVPLRQRARFFWGRWRHHGFDRLRRVPPAGTSWNAFEENTPGFRR